MDEDLTGQQLDALMDDLREAPAAKTADQERRGGPEAQPLLSPTVLSLPQDRRPDPLPACAACPSSTWFASQSALRCHCNVMHAVTWDSAEPEPVLICDGVLNAEE